MNVSSVPYSLSDIQLPGSPATKPQTKSDSVHAQSDEEQTSNNTSSNISKKSKKLEEGDMNGKASKLEVSDSTSKDIQQGSDSEKPCQSKIPEAGNSKKVKSDSSSGDERVKSRDKSRKKKRDSSDDSRSPAKKSSESSRSRRRRNRSSSTEDRGRSRSKSPRGSKSSRRGRRRSPSSEKEHRSKAKHKKGGSKKEKSKKRDKRSPSSDRSPSPRKDRSPRKPYKVRRKEGNVSSDEELHSKTQRESPKKDAKMGLKARSGSSDEESNSKTKKDTKLDQRKDRSVSSSDEHNSRSREIQKKDSKSDRKDTSVSSGDEQKSRTRSRGSPKRLTEVSKDEKSISPEKDFKNKDSEAMDVEQTRTSREKESHKKETGRDSETSSPESSPKKISHSIKGDTLKELKRKHSVSSDEDSKRTESPVKKSKPIAREASPEPKTSPEKMDSEDSKDELPASRRSRRDSSPSSKHQTKRTGSSKSRSPEKVDKDTFSKRPPSPKQTHSGDSSPEKAGAKDDKKAEESDGELPSSRECSPAMKPGERKPSTDSVVTKSGTMIVIRKEAPKQKLKIKRDNVVVVKKDKEEVAKKDKEEVAKKDKEEVAEKDREEVESKSTAETVETPEPIEEQKLEPGECPDLPPNTNYVRRKIVLSSRKQVDKPSEEPGTKKSKWGSFAASRKAKQTVSISTDSLKNWFPDFKILKEPEAVPEDLPSPVKEEHDFEMTPTERVTEPSEPKMIAVTRRLQPLPSEAALKPPTEPINDDQLGVEPTPILFVQNLVRPFTLLQLKDLLGETGTMVEDGFWIDKIKSKCFVTYETVEEAVKTRKILNGARWPMSNPKILAVSFSTEEELSSHRSGLADQPKPLPPAAPLEEDQPIRREREGRTRMVVPLREWDKDKVSQDSPEKLDRRREEDRTRDKKDPKKRGGLADDTPAKLLDDLFQKTKAVPCIYWLPLTQEQKKERDERRKQLNQERERRKQEREQENKRPRSRQRETRRSSPSRSRSPVTRRR